MHTNATSTIHDAPTAAEARSLLVAMQSAVGSLPHRRPEDNKVELTRAIWEEIKASVRVHVFTPVPGEPIAWAFGLEVRLKD